MSEAHKALQEIVDLLDPMKPEASPVLAVQVVRAMKMANATLREDKGRLQRRCKTLRDLADQAAHAQGLSTRRMMQAQKARVKAYVELSQAKEAVAGVDDALRAGADEELWPPGKTRGEAIAQLIQRLDQETSRSLLLEQELESTRKQLHQAREATDD